MLDQLLPAAVPGYGGTLSAIAARRQFAPGATGFTFGTTLVAPSLTEGVGYDSAPNGAQGSMVSASKASLLLADPVAGFGMYGDVNMRVYPQARAQNLFSTTLAGGERIVLPRQIFTLSGGYLRDAVTGFAINTVPQAKPLTFNLLNARMSDAISAGMFTLTPDLSTSYYSFPTLSTLNRRDDRENLTLAFTPGGPLSLVLRLHGAQAVYGESRLNTDTTAVLAGVRAREDGLWALSLLAGMAWQTSRGGAGLSAPMVQAGLAWSPSPLDQVNLTLTHEVDDPDEISTSPYMLTRARLTLARAELAGISLKSMAEISRADYLHTSLRETLFTGTLQMQWHLSPNIALDGTYDFNDRQANYLNAANEHVLTLGVTWTP